MDRPLKIMIVAVEPSADLIGADLIKEIRRQTTPSSVIIGVGGNAMAAAGLSSIFPISPFSVMGFTDAVKAFPLALRRAKELALRAAHEGVDIAVFIDAWAFSRLCAVRFKKNAPGVKLIKFVAPQVWASRPERSEFVKEHFDGVLTLFPFETALFERLGIKTTFVGNPNFQSAWHNRGNGERFKQRHKLDAAKSLVVLLGSRRSEIKSHAAIFGETISRLHEKIGPLNVFSPIVSSQKDLIMTETEKWPVMPLLIASDEKYDALAAADAALAVSGTISTEIAINETPMVVTYRADPLTAFVARRQMTAKFASIINIAADKEIIPEFIQEKCTPANLTPAVRDLLQTDAGARQVDQFRNVLALLDVNGESASQKAAKTILNWTR